MINYLPNWILELLHGIHIFDKYVSWRDYINAGFIVSILLMILVIMILSILMIIIKNKHDKLLSRIKASLLLTIVLIIFTIVSTSTTYNFKLFKSDMEIGANLEEQGDYIAAHNHYYDMLEKHYSIDNVKEIRNRIEKIDYQYKFQIGILYEESGLYNEAIKYFSEIITEDGVVDHIKNCVDNIN